MQLFLAADTRAERRRQALELALHAHATRAAPKDLERLIQDLER
jgi:hypothetical protein